jgi:hypothetical protein
VERLEPEALVKGAAVTIAASLPLAVLGGLIDDDTAQGLLLLGILLGFAAGGFVGGRSASAYPYSNGAVAAFLGFVVVQVVASIVHVVSGDGVPLASVAFFAFVSYGCGLTGAVAGIGRGRRA